MIKEDDELLRRVLNKADAANIHDVKGLIGYYRVATKMLANAILALNQFADSGNIQQSKKDNSIGW